VSASGDDDSEEPQGGEPGGYAPSVAERLAFYQRAGGIITPVINAVIAFLAVAAVVYFVVVVPMNRLAERRKTPVDVTERDCPECLSTIPKAARRCSFCTSEVGNGAA